MPPPSPAPRPIVLIGLMGVGKSTVGKRLAARLGMAFVDSDHEIETAAGLTVAEIFQRYGEAHFRDGERRVIARLLDGGPAVIATGGGAFMHPETRALILERATRGVAGCRGGAAGRARAPACGIAPAARRRRSAREAGGARRGPQSLLCTRPHPRPQPARAARGDGDGDPEGARPLTRHAPTRIEVALGDRSYPILIEAGLLDRAAEHLVPLARDRRLAVVTDAHVAETQLPRLTQALAGVRIEPIILPPGEATKSWATLAELIDRLVALGIERGDRIVALGGGVIGDLVGFAAAILKRGCGFVQVPTTLLAQVDSSVGGKTAINVPAGKNLVGAFHQPDLVLIDPDALDTLPPREVRAGYAEVVKYGLIDDPDFFAWCEAHGAALLAGDGAARTQAIAHSVQAKARIVGEDERETTGARALLNLGHTFGHALEAETGYSERLLHGEAVACGMALAFRFSAARGLCPPQDAVRVATHLRTAGLPTTLAEAGADVPGERLAAHMAHDKKMAGGRLPFLLARGIGRTYLAGDVDMADVARFLEAERAPAQGLS